MTSFLDGPAKGATLMLHRCPFLLRVTFCYGKFDALNEDCDEARPEECLHCYILHEHRGNAHINMGRGRGGFYPIVVYALFTGTPPDDATMRDNASWRLWCEQHRGLYDAWIAKQKKSK